MKLIHAADLHIGSKISNLNDTLKDTIKAELFEAFNRMVFYAKTNDIKVVMLSGDIFDSDKVTKTDKTNFYKLIEKNKDIVFLYLKGNHDKDNINDKELDNLKTFDSIVKAYKYDDITISGLELTDTNYKAFYSLFDLNKDDFNIVMLHGELNNDVKKDSIVLNKLKNKNIDYLALGHIHKMNEGVIDERGTYLYPGSMIGRGFDELDDKGFYVIDIENKKIINKEFVKLNKYIFRNYEYELDNFKTEIELLEKIKEDVTTSNFEIVKITLKGKTDFDISLTENRIISMLEDKVAFIKVKNNAILKVDISKYLKEESLIGEFSRTVNNNKEYDEATKNKVLNIGLKLLNGEEI